MNTELAEKLSKDMAHAILKGEKSDDIVECILSFFACVSTSENSHQFKLSTCGNADKIVVDSPYGSYEICSNVFMPLCGVLEEAFFKAYYSHL